ncbi:MAG TPA: ATP-binding protein [Chloroflexota bacterium]|nr:ATP-binding protein [Chloroflexota bacterium]HUM67387.1 ATP-binding protein [Chloroflexota bacterium]
MSDTLNVLLLEDNVDDAELILLALSEAGFSPHWRRVDTRKAYLEHLTPTVDVILADYQLPQFTGLDALQLLQAQELDIPFIIVTGAYEENGLRCMKLGAADYLLKDRLGRLGEAIRHALGKRALHREKQAAEEAEREERRFAAALVDTANALNSSLDLEDVLDYVLENVQRVIPHDGVNIMLLEDEIIRTVRRRGIGGQSQAGDSSPNLYQLQEMYYFRWMAETGQTAVVPDTTLDPHWRQLPEREWIQSYVGAPIQLHDRCIGFLNLTSVTPGFFNQQHAQRLAAFTSQVATALHNARLYTTLAHHNEILDKRVARRTDELHHALNQLQTILDNSPDPILLVKPDGQIETGNLAFKEIFGYEFTEVSHLGLLSLMSPPSANPFMELLADVLSKGKRRRLEIVARNKDGRQLDIDLALSPVDRDGHKDGHKDGQELPMLVCSLRDITALKEVQRMKEAFVSNVSHELRTPISVLLLYHGTLVKRPEKLGELIDKIAREIRRLNLIIEDLLRLSRLDQGQIKLAKKPVDLQQLISEAVADRQVLASEKQITLTLKQSLELALAYGDAGLLEQVLSILLTNALNYTPLNGRITVSSVTQSSSEPTMAGFRVQDDGPGIPLDEQKKLFERFYRGHVGRESDAPGTGLGLAIAQEIVARHGGEIVVDSHPGAGSTFTVWLPVASGVEQPAA